MGNHKEVIISDILGLEDGVSFGSVLYEKVKLPNGKVLFEKLASNATTIGGSNLIGSFLSNIGKDGAGYLKVKTLDSESALNLSTVVSKSGESELFGVLFSLDGGVEGTVYPVKRHKRGWDFSNVNNVIPMRMLPADQDDPATIMANYEVRSSVDGFVKYFVKKPKSIILKNMTKTGVDLTDYPDLATLDEDVVTVIILNIEITEEDMVEFFALTESDASLRRFNAISILYGEKVVSAIGTGQYDEHRDIIATNRYNMKTQNVEKNDTRDYYIHIYIK